MKKMGKIFKAASVITSAIILFISGILIKTSLFTGESYLSRTNILYSIPVVVIIAVYLVMAWPFEGEDSE